MNNFIATEIFENGKTHIEPFFKINRKILIFCASVCEIIPSGLLTCSSDQSAKLMRNSREAVLPTRVYHILDQKWAWMYSDDVSIQKIQKVNSFEELAELIEKKAFVVFRCPKCAWMYSDSVSTQEIQDINSFEELTRLVEKKSSVIFKCLS